MYYRPPFQGANNNKPRGTAFCSTNNGNFAALQLEIKKSVQRRHDTDGNVINLTKYSFLRDTFKLLKQKLKLCSYAECI